MGEMMQTVFDAAMARMGAAYRTGAEDAMLGRSMNFSRYETPGEETAYREGWAKGATMRDQLVVAAKAAREAAERGVVVDGRLEVVA
jgi:hypothetical protein